MKQDINKKLVSLAKSKGKLNEAQSFFLEQTEKSHNMLLWKCYLSNMADKEIDFDRTERIALLGSSNIAPLKDKLKVIFHAHNIDTDYFTGEYNSYMQELMVGDSGLYRFKPSITLIVLTIADIIPRIYERPFSYLPEEINRMIDELTDKIALAIDNYLSALTNGMLYLIIMPSLENPSSYVYNPGFSYKSEDHFLEFCESLSKKVQRDEKLVLVDTRKLIQKYPKNQIEDKRYWYLGRIRYTDLFFSEMAKEVLRVYKILTFPSKKCLVLDLDDTLWGGIIGQDGMEGIILGEDGLGKAYEDFQREILKLHEKGIILAICSKNNESDALEVLRKHKGMILKEESFVSKRINWTDKATNILEISKEINIGLDSMVFLDDSPAERKWVRDNLPQVTVPDLPEDPFLYTEFLKSSDWFVSYRLNQEDLSRNTTYKAIAKGRDLKISSKSVSKYLKALDQQIVLEEVETSALSRATQLCQKTNQFNLTTKRYRLTEIKEMTDNKNNRLYTVSVQDCFCDYGMVGLLILKEHESTVSIDTFILSCRMVGRKIEFAIIDWLKEMYKKKGFHQIDGTYEETTKNALCKDIYKDSGFEFIKRDNNAFVYQFSLNRKDKAFPFKKHIKVKALTP